MTDLKELQKNYLDALDSFDAITVATQDELLAALLQIYTAVYNIIQSETSENLLTVLTTKELPSIFKSTNLNDKHRRINRDKENQYYAALSKALTGKARSFDDIYQQALAKYEGSKAMTVEQIAGFLSIKLMAPTRGLGTHTIDAIQQEGIKQAMSQQQRPSSIPKLYHFLVDVCNAYGLLPSRDLMIHPSYGKHCIIRIPRLGRTILIGDDTGYTIHVLRGSVAPRYDFYPLLGTKDLQQFPHYIGKVAVSIKLDRSIDLPKYIKDFGTLLAPNQGDKDPLITQELIDFYRDKTIQGQPSIQSQTRTVTPGTLTPEQIAANIAKTQEIDVKRRVEVTNQFIKVMGNLDDFIDNYLVLGVVERKNPLRNKLKTISGEVVLSKMFLGNSGGKQGLSDSDRIIMLSVIYGVDKLMILKMLLNARLAQNKLDFNSSTLTATTNIRSTWLPDEQEKAKEIWKETIRKHTQSKFVNLDNFIDNYLVSPFKDRTGKLGAKFKEIPGEKLLTKLFMGYSDGKQGLSDEDRIIMLSAIYRETEFNIWEMLLNKRLSSKDKLLLNPMALTAMKKIRPRWSPEIQEKAKEIWKQSITIHIQSICPSLDGFIDKYLVLGVNERAGKRLEKFPGTGGEKILTDLFLPTSKTALSDADRIIVLSKLYAVDKLNVLEMLLNKRLSSKNNLVFNPMVLKATENIRSTWQPDEQEKAKEIWKQSIRKHIKPIFPSLDNFIDDYLVGGFVNRRGTLGAKFEGVPGVIILERFFLGKKDGKQELSDADRIPLLVVIYADEGVTPQTIKEKLDAAKKKLAKKS